MRLLTTGWYEVVRMHLDPNSCTNCIQSADIPDQLWQLWDTKHEIQPCTKALATNSAVISVIGMASDQCVNQLIHVRR